MGEEKADTKVDLGLLEEDDEFEEFPADSANKTLAEDKDANVWEDNWDDDTVEDDFSDQLRYISPQSHLKLTFSFSQTPRYDMRLCFFLI